jgi:hypothetical protein
MSIMAKTAENSRIVRLHITCVTPPLIPPDTTGVNFGVQDRHEVIFPGQLQPDGSLQFEIDVVVIHQPGTSEARWRGPYVHGKPVAPFVYLSLRRDSIHLTAWIKRLKVPLPRLSWDQVEAMQVTPCFAASISGKGSGTVPLLGEGWTLREQPSAGQ